MAQRSSDKPERKMEKAQFQEGEKILCYHGPMIYEGKCISLRDEKNEFEYFIHYNGWNKSWDEWVSEDRLLKVNEENLKKKEELTKNSKNAKKSSKRRTSIGSVGEKEENNSRSNSPKPYFARKSISTTANRSSAAKIEKNDKLQDLSALRKKKDPATEVEYVENIRISVQFPEDLRLLLSYDMELITRRKKVTKIPARVTVDDITEKYVLHKTSLTESSLASKFRETAFALKDYFNLILDKKLLYSFEKPQYAKLTENKVDFTASSVYGVMQLIRLFVKIGRLVAHLTVNDNAASEIEENINDYLRYLNLNIAKFVNIEDYQQTNSEYQRKVKEMSKVV